MVNLRFIYINWAGLAPLRPSSYLRNLFTPELLGNALEPRWTSKVLALRKKVADWLGCQADQVAFLPSTTVALWVAAHGLDWQPGDKVLYPRDDFPSNVLPWRKLDRFGVVAQGVINWHLPWPANTRMVSISTVDFSTGIEQPWQDVVQRAHQQKIWTCVDAVQSAGVKPSYLPQIDFWCSGTQKWLAGGIGLAVMVVSGRVLDQLNPPFPSWLGFKEPPLLESGMHDSARRWEMGWLTPAALGRLASNLNYFERFGWDRVTREVKARRDYLHEELSAMGWPMISCPQRWSGIVSIDPGPGQAEKIVHDGYKHRIFTAHRGEYVRLAPHIFNSMRQLEKAVRWMKSCKARFGVVERDGN